ncbi:hypothetical protein N0S44_000030 [Escherichia coli]|uniref:hypothetical protein n=1 Tax=Escherichia coli TaxID=562 RepID=UPI0039BF9B34|nr:hypothetical protein [Escherichia coli]EJR1978880.1 hypothetical protein [Escherichia coli]
MIEINADIYCSAFPNYFIYALSTFGETEGETFVLVDNTTWYKTSNKIPEDVLNTYTRIENKNLYVNL